MSLVANARMYAVDPAATQAWTKLFQWIGIETELPLDIVEHPYPAPVAALWARRDLACAFMCGWPWARAGAEQTAIAAPLMLDEAAPVYRSNIIVAASNPAQSLADLRGGRVGYTLLDSQSGFSALRHHLRLLGPDAPRFGAAIGPLTTPRRAMEAVAEGRADLAPIDSYAHALLRRHVPDLAARVRVIERTLPTPIPLLVASPGLDPAIVARLRAAFLGYRDAAVLDALQIQGFVAPLPRADYLLMERHALAAEHDNIHDLSPFLQ